MKLRYFIGIPYLGYIGMIGGSIWFEAIIIGLVFAIYDTLFYGE